MRTASQILCLALLAASEPALAEVSVRTRPSPIVLKEGPISVVIQVRGLPGVGPVKAAVNVGRIDAIDPTPNGVNILYTTPIERRFPQVLCLVLWRAGERGVEVARIPLRSLPNPGVDRTYSQLTLALGHEQIAVAAVSPEVTPRVRVDGEPVSLRRRAPGLWVAPWGERQGRVRVRAWLPGAPQLAREAALELVPRFRAAPSDPQPGVTLVVGLAAGMLHNTGDLLAPRLAAELGLDYRLPAGWLGLRALVGVSWAHQSIDWPRGQAEADVLLLPVGGALCYRFPSWAVTPYLAAGVLAQLVRTTSTVSGSDVEQVDHESVLALLGQAGAEHGLGPGAVFLQVGLLWSRVESPALEMLAGGVVVEAGYRFRL